MIIALTVRIEMTLAQVTEYARWNGLEPTLAAVKADIGRWLENEVQCAESLGTPGTGGGDMISEVTVR